MLGPHGAGRSATVGKVFDFRRAESAGQGAAFRALGATKLLFLTVVNAIGAIHDRSGQVVRGGLDRSSGERRAALFERARSNRFTPRRTATRYGARPRTKWMIPGST